MGQNRFRYIAIALMFAVLASVGFGLYTYRAKFAAKKSSTNAATPQVFTITNTTPGTTTSLGVSITCVAREVQDQFANTTGWDVKIDGDNLDTAKASTTVRIRLPWGGSLEGQNHVTGTHRYDGPGAPTVVASAETAATSGFAGSITQCDLPISGTTPPPSFGGAICDNFWTEDQIRQQFEGFAPLGSFDYALRPSNIVEGGQPPISVKFQRSSDKTQVTATIANDSFECLTASVGVYKMYDNILTNQKFFGASDNIQVPGNSTKSVTLPLPSCMAQIDMYGTPTAPRQQLAEYAYNNGPPFMGAVFHLNKSISFTAPDGPLCNDTPTDREPIGNFDAADCQTITGWAVDLDEPNRILDVHVYREAPAGQTGSVFVGSYKADQPRVDVNTQYSISGNHGFVIPTPAVVKDGNAHKIYVYVINPVSGKTNPLLAGSPKTVTCPLNPPPPPSDATDLGVTKTVQPSLINVGQTATFTVRVANNGPLEVTAATLGDVLPSGLTLLNATPSQGAFSAATGVWTIGQLAVGSHADLSLQVRGDSVGSRVNVATITAVQPSDTNSANNRAEATLTVAQPTTPEVTCAPTSQTIFVGQTATLAAVGGTGSFSWLALGGTPSSGAGNSFSTQYNSTGAKTVIVTSADKTASCIVNVINIPTTSSLDLNITKQVSPSVVQVGLGASFTVTIQNRTSVAATGVRVTDSLPTNLTLVSATPSQGAYSVSNGVWEVGTLSSGASATLVFQVTSTAVGSYTNTATISASNPGDSDSSNNSASATLLVWAPTTGPSPLVCAFSSNTVLVNQVVTAYASGGSGSFVWTAPNGIPSSGTSQSFSTGFATGGQHVITVQSGSLTAQCQVTVIVPTLVLRTADLSLLKTASPASFSVGGQAIFAITLTNSGPAAADFVTVKDVLPADLVFVSSVASRGDYDASSGIWTVGQIIPGEQLTLLLTVKSKRAGTFTNSAEVWTSNMPDNDSTPGNSVPGEDDQASAAITVTGGLVNAGVPTVPLTGLAVFCMVAALLSVRVRTTRQLRMQTPMGSVLLDVD